MLVDWNWDSYWKPDVWALDLGYAFLGKQDGNLYINHLYLEGNKKITLTHIYLFLLSFIKLILFDPGDVEMSHVDLSACDRWWMILKVGFCYSLVSVAELKIRWYQILNRRHWVLTLRVSGLTLLGCWL